MNTFNDKNDQSILQLIFADSASSLLLAISFIEKMDTIPDLFLRALTMVAYLGKSFRETHEGIAHGCLSNQVSSDRLNTLQDEILLFEYARFRFRPKGSWHAPNSPFKHIQKTYEKQHADYFYLASFNPVYFAKLYALIAARLREDKEYNTEAIRYYDYAIELDPNQLNYRYTRNVLQLKIQYLSKRTMPSLSQIIEQVDPFQLPKTNAQVITVACNLMSDLEAFTTAEEWYKKGIERFPKEASLLNNLAYLYAKYLNDFSAAKQLTDLYSQSFKGDPSFFDTLAYIELHGFQRLRVSKRLYDKCLLLDKKSHFAHTGLGDILFVQQNYKEAYIRYQKGLWNDDQFTSRRKSDVIEKIEKIIRCLEKMPNSFADQLSSYRKKLKKLTQ